ncbi:MAG: hypothetical protein HY665_06400 [Chloroflexi bacterium]|nr:hypothetical protein [Chloroflexota bacterium]
MTTHRVLPGRPRLSVDFATVLRLRDHQYLGWTRMAEAYKQLTGQYISRDTIKRRYLDAKRSKLRPAEKATSTAGIQLSDTKQTLVNSEVVDVDKIGVDPKRFQFKQNVNPETGTTGEFADSRFNAALSGVTYGWEDKEGKVWVLDGHHRLDMAKRSRAGSIRMIIDREADGVTELVSRAKGALNNIAEGKGTPFDVAKFLRDSGKDLDYLTQFGISPTAKLASRGAAIAGLDDSLFQKVALGTLAQNTAAIIGAGLQRDFANQREVAKIVLNKEVTPRQLTALIKEAKAAGSTKVKQQMLFGETEQEKSLLLTRAKLRSWIEDELAKDKRLFGFVTSKGRPEALSRGGTQVNVNVGTKLAQESATAQAIFDARANAVGAISDMLTDATQKIVQGDKANNIRQKVLDDIRATIAKGASVTARYGNTSQGQESGAVLATFNVL